eukprot:CAMPEP_0116569110 /NCGR_PEP_ID=MMETSP0397-20121206/16104_1 /TAXON_ID=216820 /ORGANISM="Cyclophora tenuis, Strain ECT3854" /LENGTH=459 /DNA_ID=CAMNT_0004096623 /DNA_START=87 /DNA_END=1466 /DNA_ORIENTATION=+
MSNQSRSFKSFDEGTWGHQRPGPNAQWKKNTLVPMNSSRQTSRPQLGQRSYSKELLAMLMATAGSEEDETCTRQFHEFGPRTKAVQSHFHQSGNLRAKTVDKPSNAPREATNFSDTMQFQQEGQRTMIQADKILASDVEPASNSPVPVFKDSSALMTPATLPCTVDESLKNSLRSQSRSSSRQSSGNNNSSDGARAENFPSNAVPSEIRKQVKVGTRRVEISNIKGEVAPPKKHIIVDDADSMMSDLTGLTGIFSKVNLSRTTSDGKKKIGPVEKAPFTRAVPGPEGMLQETAPPRTALNPHKQGQIQHKPHSIIKRHHQKAKGRVSFGDVRLRVYERVLGVNPSCTSGPPLDLGWRYQIERRCPVDFYEANKPTPRSPSELVICREERELILLSLGYTRRQLANAVRMTIRSKNQRRQTVHNLATAGMEEIVENAGRKVKRLLLLNKSTDTPKSQYYS